MSACKHLVHTYNKKQPFYRDGHADKRVRAESASYHESYATNNSQTREWKIVLANNVH